MAFPLKNAGRNRGRKLKAWSTVTFLSPFTFSVLPRGVYFLQLFNRLHWTWRPRGLRSCLSGGLGSQSLKAIGSISFFDGRLQPPFVEEGGSTQFISNGSDCFLLPNSFEFIIHPECQSHHFFFFYRSLCFPESIRALKLTNEPGHQLPRGKGNSLVYFIAQVCSILTNKLHLTITHWFYFNKWFKECLVAWACNEVGGKAFLKNAAKYLSSVNTLGPLQRKQTPLEVWQFG